MRRNRSAVATVISLAVVAAALTIGSGGASAPPRSHARGAATEAIDQATTTQQRLDALRAARQAGLFGERAPIQGSPAAGWLGQRVMNAGTDDWEPAVAADPVDPWVYVLATRYGQPKPCAGNCPTPFIVLERSSDGGRT